MDMVVRAMRERARCIALLKKKYPGLPYYDVDKLPVLMKLSGEMNNIHRDYLSSAVNTLNEELIISFFFEKNMGICCE